MAKLIRRLLLLVMLVAGIGAPFKMAEVEGLCGCDALGPGWFCHGGCDRSCSGGACVETCYTCGPPIAN